MCPRYSGWVEFWQCSRKVNNLQTVILAAPLRSQKQWPCQPSPWCCFNGGLTTQCCKSLSIQCFSALLHPACLSIQLSPSCTEKTPCYLQVSCSTSFHLTSAAAGLHPGPADVQPWQFFTVLKELLNGNMTHMQLWRQGVLLLHGGRQLFKYICEKRTSWKKMRVSLFIHMQNQLTHKQLGGKKTKDQL